MKTSKTEIAKAVNETFYVYEWFNPVDGEVFYVGKGTKDRVEDHWKDALNDSADTDNMKHRKIQDLAMVKFRPEQCYRVVKENLTSDEAYAHEAYLIHEVYGLDKLTNIKAGHGYRADGLAKAKARSKAPQITSIEPDNFGFIQVTKGITIPGAFNEELFGKYLVIRKDPKKFDTGAILEFLIDNPEFYYGRKVKNEAGDVFVVSHFEKTYVASRDYWNPIGLVGFDTDENGEPVGSKRTMSSVGLTVVED